MTITQTVEIPPNHWLNIEVPHEIPSGLVYLSFTPASVDTQTEHKESITEKLDKYYRNHASRLDDDLKTASCRLLAKAEW